MDFSAQLDDLEQRVQHVKAAATAAATENHAQIQKRLDEARAETDRAFDAANQQANATARQVDSAWEQMRADAKARGAELKAKAKRRSDQFDADVAASDAEWAEADAYAALDYADWAVGNARLAILDAIDARAYADERASALV
jgi:hypothetical protein